MRSNIISFQTIVTPPRLELTMEKKLGLKYPLRMYVTFPLVFGGILLIFGTGFFYR